MAEEHAAVVELHPAAIPFGDALPEMPRSPGECCDVGVMCVGLVHADALAAGRTPAEVGALLQAFFRIVGEVTEVRGGYTEKCDLCALRCVFGAPASCTYAADAALASARELRERLAEDLPDVQFSAGISAGASVTGWIPATRRFEPIVMCAPMTEAKRLCEQAGRGGSPVLASERALTRASEAEAARWSGGAPKA